MAPTPNRREFLVSSVAAASLISSETMLPAEDKKPQQEYYELRIYRVANSGKRNLVSKYIENALLPALNRMGINRVGVFTNLQEQDDFSITMLIPYSTWEQFSSLNDRLEADVAYRQAAASYHASPLKDPIYQRIQSKLMKAFAGMPVIELPAVTVQKKSRIFELRTYESHTTDAARRKVDMFNSGEIDIMRDVKMAPVFYGETLIADDVPNLTYMLSAENMEEHQAHWKGFLGHPEWERMKKIEKYKQTVSKISKWFLAPTSYSQI